MLRSAILRVYAILPMATARERPPHACPCLSMLLGDPQEMLSALELCFAPVASCKMRVKRNVWSCDRFDVLNRFAMVLVMVVMVVTTEGRGVACLYRKDPNESVLLACICVVICQGRCFVRTD